MGPRIHHHRLTRSEVEELGRCIERLNQIHDSVDRTAMQGKPSVKLALVEVHGFLVGLMRREMATVQRWQMRVGEPGHENVGVQGEVIEKGTSGQ